MALVAMTPRARIAVLKAPTPAEPALVRGKRRPRPSRRAGTTAPAPCARPPSRRLSVVPQPHVAVRIDVRETRDDAMRSHLEGVVDNDLRAGHQEDVRLVGEIEQAEAEVAVVAARVLEPCDGAFAGERHRRLALELGVDADRDVVGDHGQVDRVPAHSGSGRRSRAGSCGCRRAR